MPQARDIIILTQRVLLFIVQVLLVIFCCYPNSMANALGNTFGPFRSSSSSAAAFVGRLIAPHRSCQTLSATLSWRGRNLAQTTTSAASSSSSSSSSFFRSHHQPQNFRLYATTADPKTVEDLRAAIAVKGDAIRQLKVSSCWWDFNDVSMRFHLPLTFLHFWCLTHVVEFWGGEE